MKMLKKSALLLLLLIAVFTTADAQRRGDHDPDPVKHAEKQTARMTEHLGLSADQTAKVKEINLRYAEKAKAAFADKTDGDKAKAKEAHKALRDQHQAELKKVLTPDQAAKWEQMKADKMDRKGKGPGRDLDPAEHAERQTVRMTEDLGLSADQSAKVKAINQKYAEKAKADHDSANGDKTKMKEARKANRAEHDAELKKVLTKEQAAKWDQLKAERKGPKGGHGKQKGKPDKPDGTKKG